MVELAAYHVTPSAPVAIRISFPVAAPNEGEESTMASDPVEDAMLLLSCFF